MSTESQQPKNVKKVNVTMMTVDGKKVPRPCNWGEDHPAENGDKLCVSCRQWLRMSGEVTRLDFRKLDKQAAQARVKAGLPTPKAERTRKYNEILARKAALKAEKAKEQETAS